jgi:hypothetical protein
LTYKPKPVYEVGFIRKKGKATARACTEPGNRQLADQVKAGVFMGILTLFIGPGFLGFLR